MWRKFVSFLRLPWGEKALVGEAFFWLGLMRLAVKFLPFARIAYLLGEAGRETPRENLSAERTKLAVRLARAIERIQPYTPWDSNCLAQALAARQMFGRRGLPTTIYLGAALQPNSAGMIAHAWLRCGNLVMTGGKVRKNYAVVAAFAGDSLK